MTRPTEVTINAEQRIYVIPCGDGYTCWGFDNCFNETNQLAELLGMFTMSESLIGTMEAYNRNRELIDYVAKDKIDLGTWFDSGTEPIVKSVLEAVRKERMTVRIFLGETDPGKENYGLSWMDEHDTVGRIGRSMGTLKVPLLVPKGEDCGGAILTRNIIKIVGSSSAVTRTFTLYEHPAFRLPEMKLVDETCEDVLKKGYIVGVDVAGVRHANFKKLQKAKDWIDFMSGRRMMP